MCFLSRCVSGQKSDHDMPHIIIKKLETNRVIAGLKYDDDIGVGSNVLKINGYMDW